ncbi:ribosome biogenesis GTPase YlqF [Beduinella massiliensis]|uniref:ribosome biogenesis GTPase YlqF n=1 Tax=Beduinella massiliensis TaxID=1852363 RepID=UPI000C817622
MPINWYPGHMARARRLLSEQLSRVDAVVELCDARMPHASRNPDLDALCRSKKRILILNKSDLAEPGLTSAWLSYFARQGVEAMAYSSVSGRAKDVFARIERAVRPEVERQAARGVKKTVRVMVVGVPNVGKSTFINRLHGGAIAKTGDRPGVTRANQWVRVTPYLELLDTPGLLWPRLDDQTAARRLCYIGTIRDQVVDHQMLAIHLLEDLMDSAPEAAMQRFRLKEPCEGGLALLENACRGRGWLLPGGVLDTDRGASVILDEFRAGKLGRMTLERPPRAKAGPTDRAKEQAKEDTADAKGPEGTPSGDHAD